MVTATYLHYTNVNSVTRKLNNELYDYLLQLEPRFLFDGERHDSEVRTTSVR